MRKNIQRIKVDRDPVISQSQLLSSIVLCLQEVREAVGPDFPIMVDCYMALTVPYTIQLIKEAEPYKVKCEESWHASALC